MDPRDLRDAFAANLRRLRHAKGISQEDLAHEAGINRSYMSKLEKGASYPGLEIIARLSTVLEVEPAELLVALRAKILVVEVQGIAVGLGLAGELAPRYSALVIADENGLVRICG